MASSSAALCTILLSLVLVASGQNSANSSNGQREGSSTPSLAPGRPPRRLGGSTGSSGGGGSGSGLLNSRRPVVSSRPRPLPGPGLPKGEFVSKKVIVALSCQPEETVVSLNFTEPFRGVIQSGDTNSPCKLRGNGSKNYQLNVPHNACGTKHVVSSGSFFNTLFIRYHPSLEMEGDQLKSIVCKFGTGSLNVG